MNKVKGFSAYKFSLLQTLIQEFLDKNKDIEIISISNTSDSIPESKTFNALIIYKESKENQ